MKPKLIYAFGTDTPSSSDASTATFNQHLEFGFLSLDLTKSSTNSSILQAPALSLLKPDNGGAAPTPAAVTKKTTPAEMVILAHAIVCSIAFLAVMPAGALLARYYRTFSPTWFKGHWILQFGLCKISPL
jgi:hypothetical protein